MITTKLILRSIKIGIFALILVAFAVSGQIALAAEGEASVKATIPLIIGKTEDNKKIVITPKITTDTTRKEEREAKMIERKGIVDGLTREERANKIDNYYRQWDLPLVGYGDEFVKYADEYDMDWRLAPALAMRETTAGKNMCETAKGAYNVFGWGGCNMAFNSIEHAIERVNVNLSGNNPQTAHYYAGKKDDLPKLLKTYNSVIPAYPQEIMNIMKKISEQPSVITNEMLAKK